MGIGGAAIVGADQILVSFHAPGAYYANEIPPGHQDESSYDALQFRVGVSWNSSLNAVGQAQDFTVTLTDGSGDVVSTQVSGWSNALFYPLGPMPPPDSSAVPKNFLNMVRIPLSSFADAGLAVTNVTSVEFDFDQRPSGSYLIADLAFEI